MTTTSTLSPPQLTARIAELEDQLAAAVAERDRTVLEYIAGGHSRRQTAREFGISVARVQQIAQRPPAAAA